jgi:type II restriction enzyme
MSQRSPTINEAKSALDTIIKKARIHLYKPIHIAEILYRDRMFGDIALNKLDSYRTVSRRWRDEVCMMLLGRTSTSSMRYQDDVFNNNAIPPDILAALGQENRQYDGVVEAYIYHRLLQRHEQLAHALQYCIQKTPEQFFLRDFLAIFWHEAGLRRSIDKVFEVVVYALFVALVEELQVIITVSIDPSQQPLLQEFEDFTQALLRLDSSTFVTQQSAKLYRGGVTNAADRGLDMWANFGPAIQIKHLSLDEELAEDIVESVTADRIVIVCRTAEKSVILSLLNQIGWKARIQSIITEEDLITWYEKALRGKFAEILAVKILSLLRSELQHEFPSSVGLMDFMSSRGYLKHSHLQTNTIWA